ncbi:MAG: dihydropteroate synthase [Melioribacteraceae bacterium]
MKIQIIDLFHQEVFNKISAKYNVFRELYEQDLIALEIRDINLKLSNKLKKIVLTNKVICYTTQLSEEDFVDLLVLGSFSIFKDLAKEILSVGNEDLGYKISKVIKNFSEYDSLGINLNDGKVLSLKKSCVMGILNVTPDSFSDGGKYLSEKEAIDFGITMHLQGATIIDIGGESSRPGAEDISAEVEINRIMPVIKGLLEYDKNIVLSIDTKKAIVAEEAIKNGAKIINDISAGRFDSAMIDVIKRYNTPFVVMHMKGSPKNMQDNPFYDDVVSEIYDFLSDRVSQLRKLGIKNLIIDPGIGFGKRVCHNFEIIKRLNEFKGIGAPIMVGISRKSFLGKSFGIDISQRDIHTLSSELIAAKNGAKIIRTHNVSNTLISNDVLHYTQNPDITLNV